jgi:hypothetical protein
LGRAGKRKWGRSGGVERSSGRAIGSRDEDQEVVAETATGCRRGHGLLGHAAGASLLKERLGACCEMGSRLDKRWTGDVCYPAYGINLILSHGRKNRVTVRGKGGRQEDVKPCFSEYPS